MNWQLLLRKYEYEPYMVKPKVWQEADLDYNAGALSIEQLEERLGRRLDSEDFANLPLTFKNIRNKPTVLDRLGKERAYEMYVEFAENLFGYGAGTGDSVEDLENWKTLDIEQMERDLDFLGYDSQPIVEKYNNHMNALIRRTERLQWVGEI